MPAKSRGECGGENSGFRNGQGRIIVNVRCRPFKAETGPSCLKNFIRSVRPLWDLLAADAGNDGALALRPTRAGSSNLPSIYYPPTALKPIRPPACAAFGEWPYSRHLASCSWISAH
jgi:hypothetical protein